MNQKNNQCDVKYACNTNHTDAQSSFSLWPLFWGAEDASLLLCLVDACHNGTPRPRPRLLQKPPPGGFIAKPFSCRAENSGRVCTSHMRPCRSSMFSSSPSAASSSELSSQTQPSRSWGMLVSTSASGSPSSGTCALSITMASSKTSSEFSVANSSKNLGPINNIYICICYTYNIIYICYIYNIKYIYICYK